MRNYIYLILSFLAISCSKNNSEESINPIIDIQVPEIIVSDELTGEPTQVSFTTNMPWTVELSDTKSTPAWFEVSPMSGGVGTHTLTVKIIGENPSYENRVAYIKLKIGSTTQSITLTQKKKGALILTQSHYEPDAKGGEISVELKSNIEYDMTISDTTPWITQIPAAKSLATHNYTFHVAANFSRANRIGKVLFKDKESNLSDTLVVTQAGNESDTAEVNLPEGSSLREIISDIEKCLQNGYANVKIYNEINVDNPPSRSVNEFGQGNIQIPPHFFFKPDMKVSLSFLNKIKMPKSTPLVINSTKDYLGTMEIRVAFDGDYIFINSPNGENILGFFNPFAHNTRDYTSQTFYEAFAGKEYNSSQMNVQITGSQGTTTILDGVLVENLEVKKGGVKIHGIVGTLNIDKQNVEKGTITVESTGLLDIIENKGNYSVYWKVDSYQRLKAVLEVSQKTDFIDGIILTKDITGIDLTDGSVLDIAKDNYVFDGQGYSITGSSPTSMLRITGENVTIKNTTVVNKNRVNGASGVYAYNTNGTILDSLACNDSGVGLGVYGSQVTALRLFTAGNTQGGVQVSPSNSNATAFEFADGIITEEFSVFAKTSEVPQMTVKVPDTWQKYETEDRTVWSPNANDSLALVEIYHKNGFWDNNNLHRPIWDLSKPISTWPGVTIKNNRVSRVPLGPLQGDLDLNKLDGLEVLYTGGEFEFEGAQLSSLNISGLKKLKEFYFVGTLPEPINFNGLASLEKITIFSASIPALNLSGCVNLRYLQCERINLKSLDLKDCIRIDTVRCGGNQLTSLTLSGFDKLVYLDCGGNQLTSLNLTALPNLKYLSCEVNQLTSLTLNELTNLEYLLCNSNNALISLHLTTLPNLKWIDCIWNTKLTSLNMSGLPKVERISITYAPITSLDVRGLSQDIEIDAVECLSLRTIYADKNQNICLYPIYRDEEGNPLTVIIQ